MDRMLFDDVGLPLRAVGVLEELPQGFGGAGVWPAERERLPEALVADLILLFPNIESHSLNIEMKAGSSQSEFQKTYMAWCGISGNKYVICRSFEQFKDIVTQYLSLADKNVIDSLNKSYRLAEAMKLEKAKQKYQKLVKRNNNEN